MNEDEGDTYEVSIPFVCVQSEGGPYDDEAFGAGYQAGHIARLLASGSTVIVDSTVFTPLVKQLDLIAMAHGYTMRATAFDDEWTFVSFTKAASP